MTNVILKTQSWKGFKRDGGDTHWVMQGRWTGDREYTVTTRKFLHKVPYLGKRLMTHELEHILKDFDSNAKHHDSETWAMTHGSMVHNCGRAFGWRGYFTYDHLVTPREWAAKLIKNGYLHISDSAYQRS